MCPKVAKPWGVPQPRNRITLATCCKCVKRGTKYVFFDLAVQRYEKFLIYANFAPHLHHIFATFCNFCAFSRKRFAVLPLYLTGFCVLYACILILQIIRSRKRSKIPVCPLFIWVRSYAGILFAPHLPHVPRKRVCFAPLGVRSADHPRGTAAAGEIHTGVHHPERYEKPQHVSQRTTATKSYYTTNSHGSHYTCVCPCGDTEKPPFLACVLRYSETSHIIHTRATLGEIPENLAHYAHGEILINSFLRPLLACICCGGVIAHGWRFVLSGGLFRALWRIMRLHPSAEILKNLFFRGVRLPVLVLYLPTPATPATRSAPARYTLYHPTGLYLLCPTRSRPTPTGLYLFRPTYSGTRFAFGVLALDMLVLLQILGERVHKDIETASCLVLALHL